mmetsp:Transcript_1292/g.2461  ORF Transcript_1292/g.2461 Transcript_1292/m.2461 type:complete len:455 (+) Transcript_1292:830-2194(+)
METFGSGADLTKAHKEATAVGCDSAARALLSELRSRRMFSATMRSLSSWMSSTRERARSTAPAVTRLWRRCGSEARGERRHRHSDMMCVDSSAVIPDAHIPSPSRTLPSQLRDRATPRRAGVGAVGAAEDEGVEVELMGTGGWATLEVAAAAAAWATVRRARWRRRTESTGSMLASSTSSDPSSLSRSASHTSISSTPACSSGFLESRMWSSMLKPPESITCSGRDRARTISNSASESDRLSDGRWGGIAGGEGDGASCAPLGSHGSRDVEGGGHGSGDVRMPMAPQPTIVPHVSSSTASVHSRWAAWARTRSEREASSWTRIGMAPASWRTLRVSASATSSACTAAIARARSSSAQAEVTRVRSARKRPARQRWGTRWLACSSFKTIAMHTSLHSSLARSLTRSRIPSGWKPAVSTRHNPSSLSPCLPTPSFSVSPGWAVRFSCSRARTARSS